MSTKEGVGVEGVSVDGVSDEAVGDKAVGEEAVGDAGVGVADGGKATGTSVCGPALANGAAMGAGGTSGRSLVWVSPLANNIASVSIASHRQPVDAILLTA